VVSLLEGARDERSLVSGGAGGGWDAGGDLGDSVCGVRGGPAGFDPSAIRLTGNVTGEPPFKGTLQHHGWRVKEIKLGPVPEGQDEFVLAQAEVVLP
jgi:hypothetical protein